jgi:hypothetical protein
MFGEEKVLDEIDHKHLVEGDEKRERERDRAMQIKNIFCALPELYKVQAAKVSLCFKRSGALSLLF